jgi:hypothetical protein
MNPETWQDRHLDLETEDFRGAPSTGENIVRALWPKIDNRVNQQLCDCACGKRRTTGLRCGECEL